MDVLVVSSLCYVFLAVVLALAIRKFLRVPVRLLLLTMGIVLGSITVADMRLVQFPDQAVELFVGILLSMLVYDTFARVRVAVHDTVKEHTLMSVTMQLGGVVLCLTLFLMLFYDFIQAFLFAVLLLSITQFDVDLKVKRLYRHFLAEEGVLSNVVMVSFIVALLLVRADLLSGAYMLGLGLGVGFVMGLLFFRLLRLSGQMGTLFLLVVATYLLAENLGGMGIVATATLGFFFGNVRTHTELYEFSSTLAYVIEIVLFVVVGIVIPVEFSLGAVLIALGTLAVYHVVRFLVINVTTQFELGERMFVSLLAPKGTFVVGFLLFLWSKNFAFLNVGVLVVMLSLMVSFIVVVNERRFV
ncbi:MAG: cation:proton antiporter [Nanobdellota archaeon]